MPASLRAWLLPLLTAITTLAGCLAPTFAAAPIEVVHGSFTLPAPPTNFDLLRVRHVGGSFWAVGENGMVFSSDHGEKWTQRVLGVSTGIKFNDIALDGQGAVLAGTKGQLSFSRSGLLGSWEAVLQQPGGDYHMLVLDRKRHGFIAAGTAPLVTSRDGRSWSAMTAPPASTGPVLAVALFDGALFAGTKRGHIYRRAGSWIVSYPSANQQAHPGDEISEVAATDDWILFGATNTEGSVLYTRTRGKGWLRVPYAGSRFWGYAASPIGAASFGVSTRDGRFAFRVAHDLTNWLTVLRSEKRLYSAAYDPTSKVWVLVGEDGLVIRYSPSAEMLARTWSKQSAPGNKTSPTTVATPAAQPKLVAVPRTLRSTSPAAPAQPKLQDPATLFQKPAAEKPTGDGGMFGSSASDAALAAMVERLRSGNRTLKLKKLGHKINDQTATADEYLTAARLFLEWGKLVQAENLIVKAAELKPKDADIYYYMGKLSEAKGNTKERDMCYGAALKFDPDHLLTRGRITVLRGTPKQGPGRAQTVKEMLDEMQAHSTRAAKYMLTIVTSYMKPDHAATRYNLLTEMVEDDPGRPDFLSLRAIALNELGDVAGASADLLEAIRLYPLPEKENARLANFALQDSKGFVEQQLLSKTLKQYGIEENEKASSETYPKLPDALSPAQAQSLAQSNLTTALRQAKTRHERGYAFRTYVAQIDSIGNPWDKAERAQRDSLIRTRAQEFLTAYGFDEYRLAISNVPSRQWGGERGTEKVERFEKWLRVDQLKRLKDDAEAEVIALYDQNYRRP